ncbi:MAG TPA: BTAD domain-containing putative transcriptional regulator [Gemmatimonadaceae bacterium]|nr:BTAD domain-containing putative transcriptional regulator [Gemmatimonadaceae bacterium]
MTNSTARLFTLGVLDLQSGDGTALRSVLAQPRRVALLAYLALATPRGPHRRDRLLALFWPDQDESHARNALSQAVYFLRNALGADAIVSRTADELAIEPKVVWCDSVAFDEAIGARRYMEAVELYRGELLSGFHVGGAAVEFNEWLERTRADYAQRYASALRTIAAEREAAGDLAGAVSWRRRLAAQDPLNSEAALQLMRSLAAAGDPAAAIRHARIHETMIREQLGAPPDARIGQFVKTLHEPRDVAANAPPSRAEPLPLQPALVSGDAGLASDGESITVAPVSVTDSHPRLWRYVVGVGLAAAAVMGIFAFRRAHAAANEMSCVAVLPLANYSGDRSQDGLADAVGDAILTELARYQRLSVISGTSTARYKGTKKLLPDIARELNCKNVVEGSVVHSGNHVQVDAQLVDAASDRHLWAERYDRETISIVQMERDIAEQIARQLHGVAAADESTLSGPSAAASARRADPITYGLYVRGRDAALSLDPAGLRLAIELYKQAVARDSTFALGYAGLADAYRAAGGLDYMPMSYETDTAPKMARIALALDGNLSEAHTSMGGVLEDAADWPAAEREFRRAIQLAPSNSLAHHLYAMLLATLGRKQEALEESRRALELNPLDQAVRNNNARIEIFAGIKSPTHHMPPLLTVVVDPNHPGSAAYRAMVLAQQHRCAEAYAETNRAQRLAPDNSIMLLSLVAVRLNCGDPNGAMSLLSQVKQRPDIEEQGYYIALLYTRMGQTDSAFAWLDRTHWRTQTRTEFRTASGMDPIRKDPRYPGILRQAKIP